MSARANISKWAVISLILVITCKGAFADRTIYVDDDAAGANDGTSWENAYRFLQDALADANSADKPVEIRVAQGIYRPDRTAAKPNGTGDRTATFQLVSGVALRGGYASLGETDPNARDLEAYETILSGDLAGNDIDVNDPRNLVTEPTRVENSFRVVTGSGTDVTASLDGFTITAGNASGPWTQTQSANVKMLDARVGSTTPPPLFNVDGGGMLNEAGKPTVTNCTFTKNSAFEDGGGICNKSGSNTTVDKCTFSQNSAYSGGGIHSASNSSLSMNNCILSANSASFGGGIFCWNNDLTLINCTFRGNLAGSGAGLYTGRGRSMLTNCIFRCNWANTTQGCGGGIYNADGELGLTDCMFNGNSGNSRGGALCNRNSSSNGSVELANCTFAKNSAGNGNAVSCDSYLKQHPTKMAVTNCILWDGGNEIWNNDDSTITVNYSDVQGGQSAVYDPNGGLVWGEGNIDSDPLFVDPNNADYHLKSQAGRWDPNSQTWVPDDVTSPCIDAGDPSGPIGHEPFPNGGIINMGAYGGSSEASKSYFGQPVCETIVAGDINGDCKVDFEDFGLMALHWLEPASTVNSNSMVEYGIEYYMQTDKSVYHLGENVQMLFRVTNLRNEGVNIMCTQSYEFNFLVQKDGEAVWMWIHGWYTWSPGIYIAAGGSEVVSYEWDMKDDDSTQVEPGEYKAVGVMYNGIWNYWNHGINTPTEIAVPITIIP